MKTGGIQKFLNDGKALQDDLDVLKNATRFIITGDLYRLMEEKNIDQQQLCKLSGLDKSYVSRFLSGDQNFTINTLVSFANALGCTVKVSFVPKQQ